MSDALHPSPEAAAACWAQAVRANREQVDRVREDLDGGDFYAPVASFFRADPRREDDATLAALRGLVTPGETWLDIGAGGGRFALPLALLASQVVAVEPSAAMLAVLREAMREFAIPNVRPLAARWPDAAPVPADVALISHVGYDVEDIAAFLAAMETSARRLCVAVMLERPPTHAFDQLWPVVHGQARAPLPALPEMLALLLARRRLLEVRLVDRAPQTFRQREDLVALARRQLWTRPGSPKDDALQALLRERVVERDGRFAASWEPVRVGVVTWEPPDETGGVA